MAAPKYEYRANISEDKQTSHVDGKVKRMQGFLKKIAKTGKSSTVEHAALVKHEPDDQKKEKSNAENVVVEKTEEILLRQYEKDVKSALTYYKVILQKGFIQKLPGTATAVLESIINADETIESCLRTLFRMKEFEMEADNVKPLKDNLYRSITHLIRISDDVLFDSYLHVRIDNSIAFKAADAVSMSLGSLYEFVLPRIRKISVNEELLLHCSSSNHSSSNSLDALDNIPETDILDDCPPLESKTGKWSRYRDYGVSSEVNSHSHSEINLSTNSDPPPKPPLPIGNRHFYGNFSNPLIRKALSHPGDIGTDTSKIKDEFISAKKARPISDVHSVSPAFLDTIVSSYGYSSNRSSRSSLSTMSTNSLNSPNKAASSGDVFFEEDLSIKRRMNSQSGGKEVENINHEEIGISTERYTQIQKYSNRYELLAKSTLSLFNDDEEDFDLLSPASEDVPPPILPKKKAKHTVDNYMNLMDYAAADYKERPSSFYDNLPVPNVHNITEDQLINGDGLPKLPPKRGTYIQNNGLEDTVSPFRSSKVIRKQRNSKRESSDIYEEDNVPALDCKDVSHLLVFKEEEDGPLLCGGTVDALIVYAAEEDSNSLYYKAFLATYRTFVSPPELICKLLYRANRFRDKGSTHIAQSVLKILVKIMDEMFEELDKSLFDQLRSQVHRLLNIGELKLAKSLRDKIVNYCIKLQVNKMPIYQPTKSNSEVFDFKSMDLAQQMSVLDADYFVKIELPEILRWGKEQSEALSPNLSRFIGHFNSMSFWIRTLILNESRQQEREKMYRKFLKIMRILRKLNNFSSFLAILSALDSTPVRRLEWPKQYTELLAEDCKLIDSTSAFKSYRQALAESKPPCIPYLGLILTDITFIHLGNPQDLPDGKVNFVKRWQQYNILDTVRRFKEQLYDFSRNENVLDFFNEYEDHMDEDEMWGKSKSLRPRK